MKTSDLTDAALDWAVAKCEYDTLAALNIQYPDKAKHYPKISPSTDWAQGGPIIEREKICPDFLLNGQWLAVSRTTEHQSCGPTPLIASMRCYVASKLGDEVTVPEELT